jgi:hypothetical protein
MKKTIIFVILFLITAAYSDVSLGIILQNRFENNNHHTPGQADVSNSTFDIKAGPVFRFMNNDFEITPSLGIHDIYSATKQPNNETSNNEASLFLECGLYFYLLRNNIFVFSLGPKFGSEFWLTHTESTIGIGMPLNFDFDFNRNICLRISADAAWVGYTYIKNGDNTQGKFLWNLTSILEPYLFLFFNF